MNTNWKRNAILFLVSQCITLFGSQIVQFAIVWFVTLKTSSGFWVALFSVCAYLPQFLISFVGGVWADRYNKKLLIIFADFSIAVVTLVTYFLIPFIPNDSALIFLLLAMLIIRSIGAGIQTPAVNALLPQLVPSEEIMHFNGLNATFQSVVQFVAPAVAGVVLTLGKLQPTLLIDVITAVIGISIFLIVKIPLQKLNESESTTKIEQADKQGFFTEVKSGLQYVASKKIIGKLLLIYGAFVFLTVPAGCLSGLFFTRIFGNTYWYLTVLELVGFAGMAIGGILMSTLSRYKRIFDLFKTLFWGFVIFGVMAFFMGLSKNIFVYLSLMAIFGIALTVIQTTITTILQEKTESKMQGRVFGFMSSLYSLCYPIGMLIFGLLADFVSLRIIMIFSGILLVCISLRCRKKNF